MKKIVLLVALFVSVSIKAQEESFKNNDDEDYNLFISGGCHIGLWALSFSQVGKLNTLPYTVHIDKLLKKKYAIGLGYSHDSYPMHNYSTNENETVSRHNYRLRLYKFLSNQENLFSIYMGGSFGVSYWKNSSPWGWNTTSDTYWPSAQFLTGIKIKFTETFFWQTEFGVGPPYGIQSALGIKF
jgi:hypothetical protein